MKDPPGSQKLFFTNFRRIFAAIAPVVAAATAAGCLVIGATEHRIRFDEDGSGEARLRLVDIRSDGVTDSAVTRDFAIMMSSFDREDTPEFDRGGRHIRAKRFLLRDDTLSAEVVYSFAAPEDIEGLVVTRDMMYVIVGEGRMVAKTNGTVSPYAVGSVRIVWPRSARSLMYEIRENQLPPSVSLAPLYRRSGG